MLVVERGGKGEPQLRHWVEGLRLGGCGSGCGSVGAGVEFGVESSGTGELDGLSMDFMITGRLGGGYCFLCTTVFPGNVRCFERFGL